MGAKVSFTLLNCYTLKWTKTCFILHLERDHFVGEKDQFGVVNKLPTEWAYGDLATAAVVESKLIATVKLLKVSRQLELRLQVLLPLYWTSVPFFPSTLSTTTTKTADSKESHHPPDRGVRLDDNQREACVHQEDEDHLKEVDDGEEYPNGNGQLADPTRGDEQHHEDGIAGQTDEQQGEERPTVYCAYVRDHLHRKVIRPQKTVQEKLLVKWWLTVSAVLFPPPSTTAPPM